MVNNTLTSTVKIVRDSHLSKSPQIVAKSVNYSQASTGNGVLNQGSAFSIELLRSQVKLALKAFEFETQVDEIDFLIKNYKVFKMLAGLSDHLKNNFGTDSRLVLELLNESPTWQTLFINIHSNVEWEKAKVFVDGFFNNMFELFPDVAEKININVIPDGI